MPLVMGEAWTGGFFGNANIGVTATGTIADSPVATGNILWSGGVENGSFDEWHFNASESQINFAFMPAYGAPPNYGPSGTGAGSASPIVVGNGSIMDVVSASGAFPYDTGQSRIGDKSIRVTVKNSVNGSEPIDCDVAGCDLRRSQLQHGKFTIDTDLAVAVIPNNAERWVSLSVFLESGFPLISSSGFMALFGLKAGFTVGQSGYSAPVQGWLALNMGASGFSIRDTWISDLMSGGVSPPTVSNADFWYQLSYGPGGANWSGLNIHYKPDFATATALMSNLNRGGWTDFIFHFKTDTRHFADQEANNIGFIDVHMRHNSDPWTTVLEIRPINNVLHGGVTRAYDKGIGCDGAYYTQMTIGIYCTKERVWGGANNAVAYFDNLKVGDENVSFTQMTPDGSSL